MKREIPPSAVSATFSILPKGHYTFKIGEAKAFGGKNVEKESFGVRYGLTVISGPDGNSATLKPAPMNCYQQSEGGQGMSKQFLIPGYGYPLNSEGERAFDNATQAESWSFDDETGEVGSGWAKLNGATIEADVDVRTGKGEYATQQQNTFKWMPLKTS